MTLEKLEKLKNEIRSSIVDIIGCNMAEAIKKGVEGRDYDAALKAVLIDIANDGMFDFKMDCIEEAESYIYGYGLNYPNSEAV